MSDTKNNDLLVQVDYDDQSTRFIVPENKVVAFRNYVHTTAESTFDVTEWLIENADSSSKPNVRFDYDGNFIDLLEQVG